MNVKVALNNQDKYYLFTPSYVPIKLQFQEMPNLYVSDVIVEGEIAKWKSDTRRPVFISAQTGSGKNYFITHNLREYAKKNGERILYISNRVALDYQQRKELAELTQTEFRPNGPREGAAEVFSNVTVVTYQKILRFFEEKEKEWFLGFTYVVIDECHFFYSDSLFNPHTEFILKKIVERFQSSVRIYMSATFDDVLDPICYFESHRTISFSCQSKCRHYICEPCAYRFPRDFSAYQCIYFSDTNQIIKQIENSGKSEKWLIFVTNREKGKELCKELNFKLSKDTKNSEETYDEDGLSRLESSALYFDSDSRNSSDIVTKMLWEELQKSGKFTKRILVTTSVLDNGFSIKDPRIKNIVLYTNDRTEFLQELGRYRVGKGAKINLYIRKMSNKDLLNQERMYDKFKKLFLEFCGEPQASLVDESKAFLRPGNPGQVTKQLWSKMEDSRRGPIRLVLTEHGTLKPQINKMAWWRTIQLGKQIESFKKLQEQKGDDAGIIYKAQWLTDDASPDISDINMLHKCDLDGLDSDANLQELICFLDEEVERESELMEGDDSFKKFSERFQELFANAFPKDKSINRGKKRNSWKHEAIQNHLKSISEYTKGKHTFLFKRGCRTNSWTLRRA